MLKYLEQLPQQAFTHLQQFLFFPNNTVETADIQDNAITLAKMAGGTDGKHH